MGFCENELCRGAIKFQFFNILNRRLLTAIQFIHYLRAHILFNSSAKFYRCMINKAFVLKIISDIFTGNENEFRIIYMKISITYSELML